MGLVSGRGAKDNKWHRHTIHKRCWIPELVDQSGRSRSGNYPMSNVRYNIFYHFAWWLCVITFPWTIQLNSACIILLAVVWLAEGNWATKWQRLKSASWIVPFFVFFWPPFFLGCFIHKIFTPGYLRSKKNWRLCPPLISASGKPLDQSFLNFLKKSFVYSCALLAIGSLVYTAVHFAYSLPLTNFDAQTEESFHLLNPSASPLWEYFSYIQVGSWIDLHPAYFSLHVIFSVLILLEQMMDQNKINRVSMLLVVLFTFFLALLASRMAIVSFGTFFSISLPISFRKGSGSPMLWR